MSGLSPERLDALTRMLREWHPIGSRWVAVGIAPLVADMLAAEREAGAAEVRARVTAALDAVDDQDGLEGVWEALALNGGE